MRDWRRRQSHGNAWRWRKRHRRHAAAYIADNSLTLSGLQWTEGEEGKQSLALTEEQWGLVNRLDLNLFYDDGTGYVDMGLDNLYEFSGEGELIAEG